MIQELIEGSGDRQYSFAGLCEKGRPIAWIVARRARQYPIDFGHGSTFVESIELPNIEDLARRFIAAINYSGLVELEFKHDQRTREYKLLDVNARVWAWHTIAHRVGMDFPRLAWQLAIGEKVPEKQASPGIRWVRFSTDIPAALLEIGRSRSTLGAYLRSIAPPIEYAIFAWDDPFPALVDIPSVLYRVWRRKREQ
jgi:predicted ATP-grasp superfamily ATP-dependent carboligase